MPEIADQPPPIAQPDAVPVWDLVVADFTRRERKPFMDSEELSIVGNILDDMTARDAIGRERYGVPLTTNNGRHLIDAYQEGLDFAVYLRAAIEESAVGYPESRPAVGSAARVIAIYESHLSKLVWLREVM